MVRLFVGVFALLVCVPGVASAQRGGWVDVNLGVASSTSDAQTYTYEGRMFSEPYALATVYPKPSTGASFDFGGGFMFNPLVGIGVTFTGQAHEDVAGLGATIPHPFFFNASAIGAGTTDEKLTRAESGTHITVMLAPVNSGKFRFRVFGGPTFFRLKQDMASDIRYVQNAPLFSRSNTITVTGFQPVEGEGTGMGFHVGTDASYFFTRVVGVGGMVRFTRGNVTLSPEPLSELEQDADVGGIHFGGGLRLRF
jgi:hypothetical protein